MAAMFLASTEREAFTPWNIKLQYVFRVIQGGDGRTNYVVSKYIKSFHIAHFIFGKTNVTGQIFKFISHRCRLSIQLESLFAGYIAPSRFTFSSS
jgi:hypothetical protein